MKQILKLLEMLVSIVLPSKISRALVRRCKKTRNIMMSTPSLRFFWTIVLFPLTLLCDLLLSALKIIVCWILPQNTYGAIRFIAKQLKRDVTELGFPLSLSCKRAKLLWKLFTKGAGKTRFIW